MPTRMPSMDSTYMPSENPANMPTYMPSVTTITHTLIPSMNPSALHVPTYNPTHRNSPTITTNNPSMWPSM